VRRKEFAGKWKLDGNDAAEQKLSRVVLLSKMLKLNVGGQLFLTSLETLKKDPGNFETYRLIQSV